MRLTSTLCAQHIGRMFKKHWQIQGKRVARDTGALAELEKLGIEVKDPKDVLKEKREYTHFEVIGNKPIIPSENETHPNWHAEPCHIYGNQNVLLEGVPQAQVLTNTLEISSLPDNIKDAYNKIQIPNAIEKSVQNAIKASHIFDAEQVKLAKIKIPDRPTQNPPREYGISIERRNRLLINKLIFECERLAGHTTSSRRRLVDNADFNVTLPRNGDLLQFSVTAEKLLTTNRPLNAVNALIDGALPDLYPIKCTITIPKKHIYTTETFFPLSTSNAFSHPHTIFLHFNKGKVGNLHGSGVTPNQFQSRTMLKAFTVAAARAKQIYGNKSVEKLEKPIVIQSIQTDGRIFHFGVFQLNTLSLVDSGKIKNYWFHLPSMDLFTECAYKEGRPVLSGYNKDVFRYINAFYNSA